MTRCHISDPMLCEVWFELDDLQAHAGVGFPGGYTHTDRRKQAIIMRYCRVLCAFTDTISGRTDLETEVQFLNMLSGSDEASRGEMPIPDYRTPGCGKEE